MFHMKWLVNYPAITSISQFVLVEPRKLWGDPCLNFSCPFCINSQHYKYRKVISKHRHVQPKLRVKMTIKCNVTLIMELPIYLHNPYLTFRIVFPFSSSFFFFFSSFDFFFITWKIIGVVAPAPPYRRPCISLFSAIPILTTWRDISSRQVDLLSSSCWHVTFYHTMWTYHGKII